MILFAAVMALLLDRVGPSLAAALLPEVPFHPYLRLAVWTAFLGVLGLTPLVLLQAQERRPRLRAPHALDGAHHDRRHASGWW